MYELSRTEVSGLFYNRVSIGGCRLLGPGGVDGMLWVESRRYVIQRGYPQSEHSFNPNTNPSLFGPSETEFETQSIHLLVSMSPRRQGVVGYLVGLVSGLEQVFL